MFKRAGHTQAPWTAVTSGDRMDGKAMVSENSTQPIATHSERGPMWAKASSFPQTHHINSQITRSLVVTVTA